MDDELEFEIERRFLLNDTSVVEGCGWDLITQAYIFSVQDYAVRVRLKQTPSRDNPKVLVDTSAELTVKGPRVGLVREEYPLRLPFTMARSIIDRSANVIIKKRYQLPEGVDLTWEIDEFLEDNKGLWIAEIEGSNRDAIARVRRPNWASVEVTTDSAYNNENLALRPFTTWESIEDSPFDDVQ
jgi:adenylate cyclase